MTIISQEAERVVQEALNDPELPPRIRAAIKDALTAAASKARRSRMAQAISIAQNPVAPEAQRIAAYQALVDFLNGEEVV